MRSIINSCFLRLISSTAFLSTQNRETDKGDFLSITKSEQCTIFKISTYSTRLNLRSHGHSFNSLFPCWESEGPLILHGTPGSPSPGVGVGLGAIDGVVNLHIPSF